MLFTLAECGLLQAQLFDLFAGAFSFIYNRGHDENSYGVDHNEQAEIVYGKDFCQCNWLQSVVARIPFAALAREAMRIPRKSVNAKGGRNVK